MKKTWISLAAGTAMAAGMFLASAQQTPNQPASPTARQERVQKRAARMAKYLNLTPAQQDQAKAEFQTARQNAIPLRAQLKQVRQGMFQAVRANDTAAINQLSAQEANLKGQMLAMRETAFARLYSNLTPDQRAKADQLPAHLRQMRQKHVEARQNPSNG